MADDGDAAQGQEEAKRQEEQEVRSRGIKSIVEVWLARAKNPATGLEAELKKAADNIQQLEHELGEEKKLTEIMKQEQVIHNATQEKVIMMMAIEIKNLQEGKETQLSDGKDKVLKETLKKLTTAETEKKELTERLKETTKEKEDITETVNTLKKVVESVGNNLDGKHTNNTKKKIMCRNLTKPTGCKWKDRCNFSHEEAGRLEEQVDCSFWLEGHCRFSEKVCWNIHKPEKMGIKSKVAESANLSVFQDGQEERRLPPGLVIGENPAVQMAGWKDVKSRKSKRKMKDTAQEKRQQEQQTTHQMDGITAPICPLAGEVNQTTTPTFQATGEETQDQHQILLRAIQLLLQQTMGSQ